jgi:regulator of nonsense transcripts 2
MRRRRRRKKKPEPTMKRSVFPSREIVCARVENDIQGAANARIDASDDEEDEEVRLIGSISKRDEYDEEAEEDFNREFARMLADTTEVRRDVRKAAPIFDQAVPLIRKAQQSSDGPGEAVGPKDEKHMQFSLLAKKGNKQTVRGAGYRCHGSRPLTLG